MDNINITSDITKLDIEKQIAFGWASVIEENGVPVVDHQGDIISADELEKAAHKFVADCRVAGEDHITKGVGHLVESVVFSKELQDALGIDLKKIGWFVGFKVTDHNVWQRLKKGELAMFSIGGRGERHAI